MSMLELNVPDWIWRRVEWAIDRIVENQLPPRLAIASRLLAAYIASGTNPERVESARSIRLADDLIQEHAETSGGER